MWPDAGKTEIGWRGALVPGHLAAFLAVALIERPRTLRVVFTDWRTFVLMNLTTPIYLNQIGVKRVSPLTVRVLLALGPVFLIALQTSVGGTKLSGYSMAGVTAYCVIAIMAALARAIGARINARASARLSARLSARAATVPAPM